MRAFRKTDLCVGFIAACLLAIPALATPVEYVAEYFSEFIVLRNGNGAVVFRKIVSPGSPEQLTPITVSRGGKVLFLYVLPPGNELSPAAISDSEIIVGRSRTMNGPSRAVILAECSHQFDRNGSKQRG